MMNKGAKKVFIYGGVIAALMLARLIMLNMGMI